MSAPEYFLTTSLESSCLLGRKHHQVKEEFMKELRSVTQRTPQMLHGLCGNFRIFRAWTHSLTPLPLLTGWPQVAILVKQALHRQSPPWAAGATHSRVSAGNKRTGTTPALSFQTQCPLWSVEVIVKAPGDSWPPLC